MKYRTNSYQIWRKKLVGVPFYVVNMVNGSRVSLEEYLKYDLDGKGVPVSCLISSERQIVEKFGVDKVKTLDWELLNKCKFDARFGNSEQLLMMIDGAVEDINASLYELVKDKIIPSEYSSRMKEVYADRLFDIETLKLNNSDEKILRLASEFNKGNVSLVTMVDNWDMFKEKDLSYCLLNSRVSDQQLKIFMDEYGDLAGWILKEKEKNIELFIYEVSSLESDVEKKKFLREFVDGILEKTIGFSGSTSQIKLSDSEYRELFKYSSMKDYLVKATCESSSIKKMFEEIQSLSDDSEGYIFNSSIPFEVFKNSAVVKFIANYGLKNIMDFDNECGHFFTKDNCKRLKLANEIFFMNRLMLDDSGRYFTAINRSVDLGIPYGRDEFYETMRKMLKYGLQTGDFFRNIEGEFRVRNADLFISEDAPEELQEAFYGKSITTQLLMEHPDYIPYLCDKDIFYIFGRRTIFVENMGHINLGEFLSKREDFFNTMKFWIEYNDIFDIALADMELKVSIKDDISQIKEKMNSSFIKIMLNSKYPYPRNIPQNIRERYPEIFLDKDAPEELQEAFYNRKIDSDFILAHPQYVEDLRKINVGLIFNYPALLRDKGNKVSVNLANVMSEVYGNDKAFDILLSYDGVFKKIESIDSWGKSDELYLSSSNGDLINQIDNYIYRRLIRGMVYDENMPEHFKKRYPFLFLPENTPEDIKNKFYNKLFTLEDFQKNPDLLKYFGDTNVVYNFSEDVYWIGSLFNNYDNLELANANRLKVISLYSEIQDTELKKFFKEYVNKFGDNIEIGKMRYVSEVLSRLSLSNSAEIFTFREELANQILKSTNPLERLSKIEDIFIRNNLPTVGKIYSCFEILHPDFKGFNFGDSSEISPVLKNSSTMAKKIIVFADLIKAFFGSNNRSVNGYLKNVEFGSRIMEGIKKGQIQYDVLNEIEQKELITFSKHLMTLYNNTIKGKREKEVFISTGNVLKDILELSKKLSPDGTLDYNLADRVVRMFCGFAGIDTLGEAKDYISKKIQTANVRNRNASGTEMILEQGDFIKGIGEIKYLGTILQNGSVSKEYLGSSAGSDRTPLDTDVSMIMSSDGAIRDKISMTAAQSYGPIWFVLKNDERFITTRTSSETLNVKRDISKLEVFYTGVLGEDHYGIRTGFASSEINYIVMEDYDPRVGVEVVKNGFYIPVANME